MVIKGGKTYWSPVVESTSINSFGKLEQAFRVFSDIFLRHYPAKSTELIQYNHIIHTASLTYVWENVYSYDKDFRLHISRHPTRSWGIILQQVWSMRLKDRIYKSEYDKSNYNNHNSSGSSPGVDRGGSNVVLNKVCRRFNRGKCSFGVTCRNEH